jgi:hypothetical protein
MIKTAFCPYCGMEASKDEGCDHVKCYGCKNDFCFECSAKRNPILIHGNHYHRPSCHHYSSFNEVKFDKGCEMCSQLNRPCDRPKDLVDGYPPELD